MRRSRRGALAAWVALAAWARGEAPWPKAVWLTFARNEPTHVTVNWATEAPEVSAVRYGPDERCEWRAAGAEAALHHVEIPFPQEGDLFYRLETLKTLSEPVYDVEATAYRLLFPLPDKGWCWRFEVPAFGVRLVGLDLSHVQDLGTFHQTCHDYREGSEQLAWYRGVMEGPARPFTLTLNNERSSVVRGLARGEWARLMRRGTLTATGFGYFAERAAEADGYTWLNTSLNGTGDVYRDPLSQALARENSYLLFRFTKGSSLMEAALKRLGDGATLDAVTRPAAPAL